MSVITKEVDLNSYNNDWYKPGNLFKRSVWLFLNLIFFNNGFAIINAPKIFLLRLFGATIGKGVLIKPSVNIKYPWFLSIGDYSWIGENVWIDNLTQVTIGKNVCLSQGAMLLTGNHNFTKITFDLMTKSIVLEDGVWIGAKSVICPGVYCESHSILAVQSVATSRMDAYKVYQGNPAKLIKERVIQ